MTSQFTRINSDNEQNNSSNSELSQYTDSSNDSYLSLLTQSLSEYSSEDITDNDNNEEKNTETNQQEEKNNEEIKMDIHPELLSRYLNNTVRSDYSLMEPSNINYQSSLPSQSLLHFIRNGTEEQDNQINTVREYSNEHHNISTSGSLDDLFHNVRYIHLTPDIINITNRFLESRNQNNAHENIQDEEKKDSTENNIVRNVLHNVRQRRHGVRRLSFDNNLLRSMANNLLNTEHNYCMCGLCNSESREDVLNHCNYMEIDALNDKQLEDNCSICLECFSSDLDKYWTIENEDEKNQMCKYYKINKCGHLFHKRCLESYIDYNISQTKKNKCPLCREKIVNLC
jgi:hypothetical protein